MYTFSAALVILAAAACCVYFLMKRRGSILLRRDEQERAVALGIWPVGESFPSFSLPDLNGSVVSLEDFRGQQVLLVHWDPGCDFCRLLATDLARVKNLPIVLVAYRSAEENQELALESGLQCSIGLLHDSAPPKPFEFLGTPTAYLVDGQGRVSKPLAEGTEEVLALASEASGGVRLRSIGQSQIVRDGLPAGTIAPRFCLPNAFGDMVSLDAYRGRNVLLVFTDPECGPCHELALELGRFEREHRSEGIAFLMVSRGDAETNRRQAAENGIEFPVVLQRNWKVSKEYGIFATPAAFLIGEDGRIENKVATGVGPILALAETAVRKARKTLWVSG